MPLNGSFIGNGPFSIDEWTENHSKDNRMEIIYFNISKIKNGTETVIGIIEFTYLAIWDVYKNSELFIILDNLTEEWGIIAHAIEKYRCGLKNKKGITPYILVFENIHHEIPHNNEFDEFIKKENCLKLLFKSAMQLTSKYVKVPEEDITLISVSTKKDNMFSHYKKLEGVFINYQRSVKNAIETRESENKKVTSKQ